MLCFVVLFEESKRTCRSETRQKQSGGLFLGRGLPIPRLGTKGTAKAVPIFLLCEIESLFTLHFSM